MEMRDGSPAAAGGASGGHGSAPCTAACCNATMVGVQYFGYACGRKDRGYLQVPSTRHLRPHHSAEGAKSTKIIALKGPPNSTRTSTSFAALAANLNIPDAAALSARAPSRHRVK